MVLIKKGCISHFFKVRVKLSYSKKSNENQIICTVKDVLFSKNSSTCPIYKLWSSFFGSNILSQIWYILVHWSVIWGSQFVIPSVCPLVGYAVEIFAKKLSKPHHCPSPPHATDAVLYVTSQTKSFHGNIKWPLPLKMVRKFCRKTPNRKLFGSMSASSSLSRWK